jgi:predicted glycosyltransferase
MALQTYNILMYSHDTFGLGHIRRTMTIAQHLLAKGVNILILSGSPIVGRYELPWGIDFVKVPGMIKKSNTIYVPHSIKVEPRHAMHIREEIITATAKAFDPRLFIVDKVPLGLKGELIPTLRWFRRFRPDTRVILGLRDVLDDAESTKEDWERKDYNQIIDELYTEVWIYGNREIYDPIREYALPESVSQKALFTGYIPRATPEPKKEGNGRKRVLVTAGGGGDGYPIMDNYLKMVEQNPHLPFKSTMVSGPFVPSARQDELAARAKACGVKFHTFMKRPEKRMAQSDLIISMGGYNTVCEILSLKKVSLIIPRESPRLEQLIRARLLHERGLADYLKWNELSPGALLGRITALLENPKPYEEAIANVPMTGLDFMRTRLAEFRGRVECR